MKVTCNGLGSGIPPYSKEVPTFDLYQGMTTQGVSISIPLRAYERLVNWASVSRTFDGVLNGAEPDEYSLDELAELRQALCDCHQAVRRHWSAL